MPTVDNKRCFLVWPARELLSALPWLTLASQNGKTKDKRYIPGNRNRKWQTLLLQTHWYIRGLFMKTIQFVFCYDSWNLGPGLEKNQEPGRIGTTSLSRSKSCNKV